MVQNIRIDSSSLDHKVRVIGEHGNIKLSFTILNSFKIALQNSLAGR